MHLQLQYTVDENGGPPDRYRPARCENPNLTGLLLIWVEFGELVPPGDYTVSSLEQKAIHLRTTFFTNRRRNRLPPGIIPRTVWKPQLRAQHCWRGFVKPVVPIHSRQEGSASSLTMT